MDLCLSPSHLTIVTLLTSRTEFGPNKHIKHLFSTYKLNIYKLNETSDLSNGKIYKFSLGADGKYYFSSVRREK